MPWTFATFLVGSLALAGIWPLAGFWSKDLILLNAWEHTPILFWLAMITVFMTAFYMFRVIFMTFGGKYRGGDVGHSGHSSHGGNDSHGEPHESPLVMLFPMVILALFAIGAGWSFWAGGAAKFLGEGSYDGLPGATWEPHAFFALFGKAVEEPLPLIALAVALGGILLAYAIYSAKWISSEKIGQVFAPIYTLLSRKYFMDELYEQVLVVRVLVNGIFRQIQLFDTYVVDGIVNGLGKITVTASGALRRLQTGQLQGYGLAFVLGIVIIMAVFFAYR
jgi:NADH-quinone oxidoreductase subunit L